MNIVIFGGQGFIASNLYKFYIRKYPDAHFSLLGREDICKSYQVYDELKRNRPDIIINCAAEIYNPHNMWFSNVALVQAILEWMVTNVNKPARFIQIGSSLEYGHIHRPINECDPVSPVDLYSGTKAAATMLCQGYSKEYDLKIMIARPFSVYGPYEKHHRLFPTMYHAFYNNEPMTLFEGNHDFIYVDDFIAGIDILVDLLGHDKNNKNSVANNVNGSIVNFGTGISTSNFELLEIFKEVTGINNPPVEIKKNSYMKKFETDRVWVNDPWISNSVFGFQPKYDLRSGIKEYIKRMKNGCD